MAAELFDNAKVQRYYSPHLYRLRYYLPLLLIFGSVFKSMLKINSVHDKKYLKRLEKPDFHNRRSTTCGNCKHPITA